MRIVLAFIPIQSRMKFPRSNDDVSDSGDSLPTLLRSLGNGRPPQSLFSLLLEIENRLRAEARDGQRILAKGKNYRRPGAENLSRYVE